MVDRLNMDTIFSIREAAERVRRSRATLQRWDRTGVLVASRTPTNRRFYTRAQLDNFLGVNLPVEKKKIVAYCRVSSQAQRPDLKNQRSIVVDFCKVKGFANVEHIEEIGGGLNFKRPLFLKLIDSVISGEVSHLVVAHRDRLARFGFQLIQHLCQEHDCELLVIDDEKVSPEQEMIQDMLAIVHCFSARLCGLRNYRKALKKALVTK